MSSVKIWNIGFDWEVTDGQGNRIYAVPPTAKSGALVVNYPRLGEYVEVSLVPPNARGMGPQQLDGFERATRKRIERIIKESYGKLSLVAPEDIPPSQDEIKALKARLAELEALEAANSEPVEPEPETEEQEEETVEVSKPRSRRQSRRREQTEEEQVPEESEEEGE